MTIEIDRIAWITNKTAEIDGDTVPVVIIRNSTDGVLVDVAGVIGIYDSEDAVIYGNNGDVIAAVAEVETARPADREHPVTGVSVFRTAAELGSTVAILGNVATLAVVALRNIAGKTERVLMDDGSMVGHVGW